MTTKEYLRAQWAMGQKEWYILDCLLEIHERGKSGVLASNVWTMRGKCAPTNAYRFGAGVTFFDCAEWHLTNLVEL